MPQLTIRLARGKDKPDVLTCIREDGSTTWSRLHAALPVHDISHYSVESSLALSSGFFGLVAQGWEITDFGSPYPRGPIPDEAAWVESVVSVFWRTFVQRESPTHEEVREQIAVCLGSYKGSFRRDISDAEMDAIRALQGEITATWARTPIGSYMELVFPAVA